MGVKGVLRCTWKDPVAERCTAPSEFEMKDRLQQVWARLCPAHFQQINEAIDSGNPKRIVATWIAANGGPEAMARKM